MGSSVQLGSDRSSCFHQNETNLQVRFGDGNGSWDKPIVSALESDPTMADLKMLMLVPTPMATTHRRSQRHGVSWNMLYETLDILV